MTQKSESENQAIKMQKLRHAVERIRRVQMPKGQSAERRSWFKRLLDRLGLANDAEEDEGTA